MKLEEIRKIFDDLRVKYDLPLFDEIDKEFEIKDITNGEIVLREIRDRILDVFNEYIKVLEGIIQPENNVCQIYESRIFSDKQKEDIFKHFKRLMYIERFSLLTELEDGDEKVAEFIRTAMEEWKNLKPKIITIIKELKDSWTKEDDIEESVSYLG